MNYTILQVGDVIRTGDEWFDWHQEAWLPVDNPAFLGNSYSVENINLGWFIRRPTRRTDIEIVAPDDGESGFWVSLKNAEEFDLEDDNYTLSVPIAYAQKVIDAIKEVAGL